MPRLLTLFLLMCCATTGLAPAQSAADDLPLTSEAYFHRAAQAYISGEAESAKAMVQRGLEDYPNDGKLRALQEKLDQEEEQGSGSSGGEEPSEKQGQDPSDAPGQQNDSDQQDAQPEEQQPGPQGEPQGDPQQNQPQPAEGDGEQSGQEQPPSGSAPGANASETDKLSRAQAARILEALQTQEEQLLRQVQKRATSSRPVEKDW